MNRTAFEPRTETNDTPEYTSTLVHNSDALAGRGFAQKFGLHPGIAVLIFIVDSMLFAGDIASAGLLIPVSVAAAIVLGIITFMAQRKWYNDDSESAFIKALTLTLLTAIPAPLPAFLSVPTGIIGLFGRKNR